MATSSDVGSKLLAWMMAGAGTLLAYSAFRNRLPWDVIRDIDNGQPISRTSSGTTTATDLGKSGTTDYSFSASVPRIRMIANREMEPDLVSIRPHGKLDRDAAASLERIHAKVGYVVPLSGAWRSYAEQAAQFFGPDNVTLSDGSRRFADPRKSLHVVGLAVDVRSDYMNRPDVIAAFQAEGWQRARPDAEAWHWSYLVRG